MQSALSATAHWHTFRYAWLGTQKELPSPGAVVVCHCCMTILLRGCGVIRAMTQKNAEYIHLQRWTFTYPTSVGSSSHAIS